MSSPERSVKSDGNGHRPAVRAPHRARLAAVCALIVLFFFFWFALSLVANDPVGLVLSFFAVFLVAFSAWMFLISRGILGLLVLPLALFAVVALATYGYDQKFQLLALLATIALFGFLARYAVRHHEAPLDHAVHRHARPVQAARKNVLIINPKSGGGKAERFNLSEEAEKRSIVPLLLRPGDDLCGLAKRAVANGAEVIGMAGGDGSQALVATIAMRHDVALVCVPAGTRNHFALDLGLDRDDLVGALDAFADGIERRIDLACVNERVFVNNASLGVYAHVVQSDAYRDAKLGTWKRMLPEILGKDAERALLEFAIPHARAWKDAALVIVSNNPYQLRRLGGVGSRPHLDTGRLGIFAARASGARTMATIVTLGTVGQHRRLRSVQQWSSLEFEVRSGGPIAVGLDGEAHMLEPPLRFVSLPAALRVRVPRHARGISPARAAVPLNRRNLVALTRIAAGKPAEAPLHQ